jgi:hypothetical protein
MLGAALAPLAGRVRLRWLLGWGRAGLLWGLAGAAAVVLSGRLLGRPEAVLGAAITLGAALVCAAAGAVRRWPTTWDVARGADDLGLAERATSALYAAGGPPGGAAAAHPAAPLLAADAVAALRGLDPAAYRLVPEPGRWWTVVGAGLACLLVLLAPVPALGRAGRRAAETAAVGAARGQVSAIATRVAATAPAPPARPPAAEQTLRELQALEKGLAEARSVTEAARAIEQTQARLAGLPEAQDYAWQRALSELGAAWGDSAELGAVARALQSQDPRAIQQAMADLARRAEAMTPEQRQRLQVELQAGANGARDLPALAGALRQGASRLGAAGADPAREGGERQGGTGGALDDLAAALTQGASRAAGARAVQGALAGTGQARASLGEAGATAGGSPTGSAAGAGAGGAGGQDPGGAGTGAGAGAGAAGRQGGGSAGSGTGSGTGAGSGGGAGIGGSGTSESGRRTSDGQGGVGSGQAGGPPGAPGAVPYDPVYAPGLPGGEGGPAIQASGDVDGASGETVDLPESPLTAGARRPYDQVYGEYERAARQSLGRQSLPPALQGLVRRYFSSIDPGS